MRLGIGILAALALASCRPSGPTSAGPNKTGSKAAAEVQIDAEEMMSTIQTLASDELGGRYSLHTDIDRAASVLIEKLTSAGVKPVGEDFRHPFDIAVGADVGTPPKVTIARGGEETSAGADAFGPVPGSASGTVSGPLAFVGYGAVANDPTRYDDLAGIDLAGKIAVVFLDAPRRPDSRALYGRIREIATRYESQAGPLRDADDLEALTKLQAQTRAELGRLVTPFLGGAALPEHLAAVPDDPTTPLPSDAFASLLFMPNADAAGPSFPFSTGRLRNKLARLVDAGAVGIITVRGPRSFIDEESRRADALPDLSSTPGREIGVPVVQMKWETADELLRVKRRKLSSLQGQIERELKPVSTDLGAEATISVDLQPRMVQAPNVIGQIPGKRKDEFVILGAHYDHIGTDEDGRGHCRATVEGTTKDIVCNGADDNASGTAVVLEVARVLASRPEPPERTVVFTLFAGEELGLLGSRALAAEPPEAAPWKDGRAVAMVNIDMVGRLRTDPGLLVGGVGSSPQWMQLFETAGWDGIPITFDRSVTTRSDHAAFYELGIPVVFMFTGVHGDYHAPGDEAAQIDPEGLHEVAELTLGVIEQIARGSTIDFAEPDTPEEGLVPALPGDNEATVELRVGYP